MKKTTFKKITALICTAIYMASFIPQAVYSSEECPADTPTEYVFKLQNSDKSFILIDKGETKDSAFFVLAKDFYGSKIFDKNDKQILNTEDKDNIAGYLNGEFLEMKEGLPEEIKRHIDKERLWKTEAGNIYNSDSREYTTKAGVNILSETEYKKYQSRIGCRDGATGAWMLRTGMRTGSRSNYIRVVAITPSADNIRNVRCNAQALIRPAFYLDRDFFLTEKLSLADTGSTVKRIIAAEYSVDELEKAGYSKTEVEGITKGEVVKVTALYDSCGNFNTNKIEFKYDISVSRGKSGNYSITYSVEDDFRGITHEYPALRVSADGLSATKGTIKCPSLPEGCYTIHFVIKDGERLVYSTDVNFSVMDAYKDRFMDEYTKWGVCSQFDYDTSTQGLATKTALLKKAGIKTVRGASNWNSVETTKGTYSWASADRQMKRAQSYGINFIACLGYNNLRYGAANIRNGIKNEEQRKGTTKFMLSYLDRIKNVKEIEVWNEPDMAFWTKDGGDYYVDLSQYQKYVYNVVKEAYPDIAIDGGCIALTGKTDLLKGLFENGSYPYMDCVSLHAYNQPLPFTKSFYEKRYAHQYDLICDYGGWKRMIITETGAPTGSGNVSISETQQGKDIAKAFLLADIYGIDKCMIYTVADRGTNPKNAEDMFGVLRNNYFYKPAYIALKTANQSLAGAVFVGEVNLGENIVASVYNDGGNPVLVAWLDLADESAEVDLKESKLTVRDTLGKEISSNGKITLTDAPVYVFGLGEEWLSRAMTESVNVRISEFKEKFEENLTGEMLERIEKLESDLQVVSDAIDMQEAAYSVGDMIVDYYAKEENIGKIGEKRLSQLLYEWFGICKVYTNFTTSFAAEKNTAVHEVAKNAINALSSKLDKDRRENGIIYPYAAAMLEYAKNYERDAKYVASLTAESPVKNSVSNAFNYASEKISGWAEKMLSIAVGENKDLILYPRGKDLIKYEGMKSDINVQVINSSSRSYKGTLRLVTSDGTVNSESDVFVAKADKTQNLIIPFDGGNASPDEYYSLEFYNENDECVKCENVKISLVRAIELEPLPSEESFEKLSSIRVKVTNNAESEVKGTLTLKAPEGWSLAGETMPFVVPGKGSSVVSFAVTGKTSAPFNYYSLTATAQNDNGATPTVINYPLSFLTIAKAENAPELQSFDGNIDWWKDAYPIYLAYPKESDSETSWKTADISGRIFMKWDSDNIYLLADIYDDFYVQNNKGQALWNGDSIQMQFDTLNDKATSYQADDLEIGFALAETGSDCYIWNSADGREVGGYDGSCAKIVRRAELNSLRYYIKLPKEIFAYSTITTGQKYGFNAVINDADFDTRETMSQFTKGLGETKNPSLAYSFETVDYVSDLARNSNIEIPLK